MKKIVGILLASVCLSTVCFAETKMVNAINFAVPLSFYEVSGSGVADTKFTNTSFDLDYTGLYVFENNVTLNWGVEAGFSMDKTDNSALKNFYGFNANVKLGAGYSFINTDRDLLALTAFTGFNFIYDWYTDNVTTNNSRASLKYENQIYTLPVGLSLSGSRRFNSGAFGLFYGVDFSYNIPLKGKLTVSKLTYNYDQKNNITVTPKVGLSFYF